MFTGYNWVDFVIIGMIVLSVLISLIRGFVREALSLIVWILAFVIAFKFANQFAGSFSRFVENPSFRMAIAFLVIFFGILLLGAMINYVICLVISKSRITGFIDRFLGLFFGAARGVLLVAVLIMVGQIMDFQSNKSWWAQSQLIPKFYGLSNWLSKFVPEQVNEMRNSITVIPPGGSQNGAATDQDMNLNAEQIQAPTGADSDADYN